MEILRMDYRFTAVLIIMITLLALFGGPAHPRNEYLNEYGVRCGEFEVSTERRDTDYNYSDSNTHEDEYVRFFGVAFLSKHVAHDFLALSLLSNELCGPLQENT